MGDMRRGRRAEAPVLLLTITQQKEIKMLRCTKCHKERNHAEDGLCDKCRKKHKHLKSARKNSANQYWRETFDAIEKLSDTDSAMRIMSAISRGNIPHVTWE